MRYTISLFIPTAKNMKKGIKIFNQQFHLPLSSYTDLIKMGISICGYSSGMKLDITFKWVLALLDGSKL